MHRRKNFRPFQKHTLRLTHNTIAKKIKKVYELNSIPSFLFHLLLDSEDGQQNYPNDEHVDPDVLGDGAAFIENPPRGFKGIIVAEGFQPEPHRSIQNEHATQDNTGLSPTDESPEAIEYPGKDKCADARIDLGRMHGQCVIRPVLDCVLLLLG